MFNQLTKEKYMGCWNGTCGISQLPITAGAKVKAILLLQSEYHQEIQGSSSCYSSNFFRPWFFPVTAEYNNYGSIENIVKDWNSKYMLETFRRWVAEGEVKLLGEHAEINDPGITKFNKLEDVFACVERGSLVKKGERTDKYLKISLFMVLDSVYHAMIKASKKFMNKPENNDDKKYYEENRAEALKSIANMRQGNLSLPISGDLKDDENTKSALQRAFLTVHNFYVNRLLGGPIEEHCAYKHYKNILYSPNVVTVEDFMVALDNAYWLETAMCYLRKLWIPQTGQGSQSEELEFNKALNEAVSKHIRHRNAEMKKWHLKDEKVVKETGKPSKQSKKKAKNEMDTQ